MLKEYKKSISSLVKYKKKNTVGYIIKVAAVLEDLEDDGEVDDLDLTKNGYKQYRTYLISEGVIEDGVYTKMKQKINASDALTILTAAVAYDDLESVTDDIEDDDDDDDDDDDVNESNNQGGQNQNNQNQNNQNQNNQNQMNAKNGLDSDFDD